MLIIAVAIGGGLSVGLGRTVCIATCGGNNGHPPRGDAPVVTGLQPSDSERGPACRHPPGGLRGHYTPVVIYDSSRFEDTTRMGVVSHSSKT